MTNIISAFKWVKRGQQEYEEALHSACPVYGRCQFTGQVIITGWKSQWIPTGNTRFVV